MKSRLDAIARDHGVDAPRLNYLVHVDDRRRVAYFETPKVACTSIKKYMQDQYVGAEIALENRNLVHNRALSPLKQLRALPDDDVEAVFFGDYRRFAFVRDPFTRVLSAYLDKIVTNQWERDRHLPRLGFAPTDQVPFDRFLAAIAAVPDAKRDIHFASQFSLLLRLEIEFAFVGRFETFGEDFARLQRDFYGDESGRDLYAFGSHHRTGADDRLDQFYDAAAREAVRTLFADDFRAFGYG
jgi:hypothetical protein